MAYSFIIRLEITRNLQSPSSASANIIHQQKLEFGRLISYGINQLKMYSQILYAHTGADLFSTILLCMIIDVVVFSTAESVIDQIVATASKDRTVRLWKVHSFLVDVDLFCYDLCQNV